MRQAASELIQVGLNLAGRWLFRRAPASRQQSVRCTLPLLHCRGGSCPSRTLPFLLLHPIHQREYVPCLSCSARTSTAIPGKSQSSFGGMAVQSPRSVADSDSSEDTGSKLQQLRDELATAQTKAKRKEAKAERKRDKVPKEKANEKRPDKLQEVEEQHQQEEEKERLEEEGQRCEEASESSNEVEELFQPRGPRGEDDAKDSRAFWRWAPWVFAKPPPRQSGALS